VEIKTLVRQGLVEPLKKHGKSTGTGDGEEKASLPGLTWSWALKDKGIFYPPGAGTSPGHFAEKAWTVIRNLANEGYFTLPEGKDDALSYD